MTLDGRGMGLEGWHPDPFEFHEERLFQDGEPTPLVKDDGVGSYDQPPLALTSKSLFQRVSARNKAIAAVIALAAILSVVGIVTTGKPVRIQQPTDATTLTTPVPDITPALNTTPITEPAHTTTEIPVTTEPPVVAAPTPVPIASTPPVLGHTQKTLAIVGDSITYISGGAISREFKHYSIHFMAHVGATMAEMFPAVQSLASTSPRAVIIELGTNDAYTNNAGWHDAFVNEENAVVSQRCVVFLTVSPNLGTIATDINQSISDAVTTHTNFHVLDWGDIEFTNPLWVRPDEIHPTALGEGELAILERQAVKQDCLHR